MVSLFILFGIHMVKMLYEYGECAVSHEGEESEWFKGKTGVKQGDVMSGFIFLVAVDWVMRSTIVGDKTESDGTTRQN